LPFGDACLDVFILERTLVTDTFRRGEEFVLSSSLLNDVLHFLTVMVVLVYLKRSHAYVECGYALCAVEFFY
jgi:hypothetical protein